MNAISVSLKTSVISVPMEGTDGNIRELELREMSAQARDTYLDQLGARINKGDKGEDHTIKKFEGMHGDLLCLSLWDKTTNQPIPKPEIQSWPSNVVTTLFKASQGLNKLNQEPDETKKD